MLAIEDSFCGDFLSVFSGKTKYSTGWLSTLTVSADLDEQVEDQSESDVLSTDLDYASSLSDSASSHGDVRAVVVGGKRRADNEYQRRKIRLNIVTRMVKNDVRHSYPAMYINVMSSVDPALIRKFVHHYCRGDCAFTDHAPKQLYGGSTVHAYGLADISTLFAKLPEKIPDVVSTLLSARVIRRAGHDTSTVLFITRAQATVMPHLNPNMEKPAPGCRSEHVPGGRKVDLTVSIAFHLEADKRIAKIEFSIEQPTHA